MKEKLKSKWLLLVLLLLLLTAIVTTQFLANSIYDFKKAILPIALFFFLYCVVLGIFSFAVEIFSKGKIHAMLSMNSITFGTLLFSAGITFYEAVYYKENKLREYYNSNEYINSAEYSHYRDIENIVDTLGTKYLISRKIFESDTEFINYTCGKSAQSDTFYFYAIYRKDGATKAYQVIFKEKKFIGVCHGRISQFPRAEDFVKILGLMISDKEKRNSTQNKKIP